MNEMIERVARAICAADGQHPDHEDTEGDGGFQWELYKPDARAAIEAMREPTLHMLNATCPQSIAISLGRAGAEAMYRNMINAALNDSATAQEHFGERKRGTPGNERKR